MPARDRNHDIVGGCPIQAGWSIIMEQYAVVAAEGEDGFRRLFINIAVESQTAQIVLVEVKALDSSPVRQFLSLSIYFLNPAHRKLAA